MQQAIDECQREFNVRQRCFPGWIQNGKVSASDADDRLTRLGYAIVLLKWLKDEASTGATELEQHTIDPKDIPQLAAQRS